MDKWTCFFCKGKLEVKNKYTKSGHLANCKKFKQYKTKYLTKEYLIEEYIKNEKSAIEIAKEHNLESATAIISLLKKFAIKKRNIKESKKLKRYKEKFKNTNLKRYGIKHNFCKNHPSRIKFEKKLKEEGFENVFQKEGVKEKIKETLLERYGVTHPMLVDEIKRKIKETLLKRYGVSCTFLVNPNYNNISKPHKIIIDILNQNGVSFEIEKWITQNFRVDIFTSEKIIEIYGDYWHANPTMYNPDDILNIPNIGQMCAKDIWKKDNQRIKILSEKYNNILILWEYDIYNDLNFVKEKLWKFLKLKK